MRWWLLAAGAAVLAIISAAVLLRPPGPRAVVPVPAPTFAPSLRRDAGTCAEVKVPAKGPAPSTSLTLSADPALTLSVDGFPFAAGARVMPGQHLFEARASGVEPLHLPLEVKAFTPVVLELRAEGTRLVAVVAGATAPGCEGLELEPGMVAGASPSAETTATALATGDCRAAFEQLRRWPENRRPPRLLEAALSLTGRRPRRATASVAERLAERARPTEAALERAWLVARWDATTEQLSHATSQLASSAMGVVTAANERMETLSDAFGTATAKEETQTQRDLVEAATRVMRTLADGAVALHPTDCAWRATVQGALQ